MDKHVRTVGTLNMVFGIVGGVAAVLILLMANGVTGLLAAFDDPAISILVTAITLFTLALSIPCVIAGFYLRGFAEWARTMLIVTSALNLLNVPLGMALGVYSLWVLLTAETEPLFIEPPPRAGRAHKPATVAAPKFRAEEPQKPGSARSPLPSASE